MSIFYGSYYPKVNHIPQTAWLTAAVQMCVIKTNSTSITDQKAGDKERHKEKQAEEPQTDLIHKLSAECLELEAAGIVQLVAVHLSSQDDAERHHLLQHSGGVGLHCNVIVQLHHWKESYNS